MSRRPRVMPVGIPQHIIRRGNNRQACFGCEADMKAYLHWLREFAVLFEVDIHAWVLMTNHVHLLATPSQEYSLSQMISFLSAKKHHQSQRHGKV